MPYNSFNEGSVESYRPGIISKSTGEKLLDFESFWELNKLQGVMKWKVF